MSLITSFSPLFDCSIGLYWFLFLIVNHILIKKIFQERLKREFKLDVYVGELQVGYRERPRSSGIHRLTLEEYQLEQRHIVTIELRVDPKPGKIP